ncbi:MAG: M14-type cytosolic carboxypeptidase [Flammeovirgaceae bacterium]
MFESGNLDRVVMVSPTEYDLYMRPDTNNRGHHQWFYFKITSR